MATEESGHSRDDDESVPRPAQSQLDFEVDFFSALLEQHPDFVEAAIVHANNLTAKGNHLAALELDQRLSRLRPSDPLVHYNLACSYSLLGRVDAAFATLRTAISLGYDQLDCLLEDRDLENVRSDPRFRELLELLAAKA